MSVLFTHATRSHSPTSKIVMFVPFKTQPGGSVWFLEIGAEGHESSDLAENEKKIPVYHENDMINHKNYNLFDCDWFKIPIFHQFTCQVAVGQFVIGKFVIHETVPSANHLKNCDLHQPITFKVVVS